MTEICKPSARRSPQSERGIRDWLSYSGGGFALLFGVLLLAAPAHAAFVYETSPEFITSGDFNGDGRADALVLDKLTGNVLLCSRVSSNHVAVISGVDGADLGVLNCDGAIVTGGTFGLNLVRVSISARMRLKEVIQRIEAIPMGGTDCALPMLWAARNKLNVAGFITYTDSETWAGNIHPAQALRQYRAEFVGDAKAVVVGMTSNGFTLAEGDRKSTWLAL